VARRLGLLVVLVHLAGCAGQEPPLPPADDAPRTRRAQIVDVDTGRPIPGALVFCAFYLWPKRGFGDFPVSKVFRDSVETRSDQDGRFSFTGPFNSGSYWSDELHIFKAGYGPWRFQEVPGVSTAGPAYRFGWAAMWERFARVGIVIELRPLRTREERLIYVNGDWPVSVNLGPDFERTAIYDGHYFFDVPADRLTTFQAVVDEERASLGLPPRRLDGRLQPR
jgi:hypothetical protein